MRRRNKHGGGGRREHRLGAFLARSFVRLRWVVVILGVAGIVWAAMALPSIPTSASGSLRSLVPPHSSAVRAEEISATRFGFPLLSRTIIVVRDPHGLSPARQLSLVDIAARLALRREPGFSQIRAALPLSNSFGSRGFTTARSTTMLLYLLFAPSTSSTQEFTLARQLVHQVIRPRAGEFVGVTGEVPAELAQENLISARLLWVEVATLLVAALAVAIQFRAVGASLLTLGVIIGAYLVADRVVAQLAIHTGSAVPSQAIPILVVLVFGVCTDYSIFFLSRFRALLGEGRTRREAAVTVVRQITPIVFTAGITVAAGTAALLVARLGFIRGFGPALAIAVAVAMLVAVTLVPAALALGGRRLYWPGPGCRPAPAYGPRVDNSRESRRSVARLAARHPLLATALALAIVIAGASGLSRTRASNELVGALPAGSPVRHAYRVAQRGFAPGVLAPAVVVTTGPGAGSSPAAERLERELARQPGVTQVFGPAQRPPGGLGRLNVWRAPDAARYVLFMRSDPLGPKAISNIDLLQQRLPRLVSRAGLGGTRALVAGDTALSSEIVHDTLGDLGRVIPTMLAAIFVVIAIYLRALVAPLYLVLTSVLAAAAALGLTTWVMQDLLGYGQLTYYVIFTVAVMLISLGSDYNVFLVARVWQEARRRTLGAAVAVGGTRASRPIATAATVLAASFALVAIVPLQSFRELAFAMAIGLLVDGLIIRAILVPALLVMVGPRSAWPGHKIRSAQDQPAAAD